MIYTWATASHPGLIRDGNEDAVYPEADGQAEGAVIVAVADGMGGHVAGEVASRLALQIALETQDGPAARVVAANRAVLEAAYRRPDLAGMGTTLTFAMFGADGELRIGHVGDSRAYLLRNGMLRPITTDHSLVAEFLAAGRITPQEAARHPQRNVLTRAVGVEQDIEVDEVVLRVEPGDRVMLCSDGLTNMLTERLISSLLRDHPSPQGAAWELVEAANRAGGEDNITVAVVDVAGPAE